VENEQINNTEKYRAVEVVPPSWSTGESVVLKDDMDAQFSGLWADTEVQSPRVNSKSASPAPVPALSSLFDRLPLHHQHGALAAFYKERLETSDIAEDVWSFTREDCNDFFNTMHHEDQVRILFFAIGHETVEGFLKRFPVERKDLVADLAAALSSAKAGEMRVDSDAKFDLEHSNGQELSMFLRDGSVTLPSTHSETDQGSTKRQQSILDDPSKL
jgi:hypothetical protein